MSTPATTTRPFINSGSLSQTGSGKVLTLFGQDFGDAAGLVRYGRSHLPVMSWSNTAITAQLPFSGYHGRIRLVVVRTDHRVSNVMRVRF
jgi:hypothetical protein